MINNNFIRILLLFIFLANISRSQTVDLSPETLKFEPFVWPSESPDDCPLKQSENFNTIKFLGFKSGYHYGDTWYPIWTSNDQSYSPWTDRATTKRLEGYNDLSHSGAGLIEINRVK
jgi:hypothetical protein